MDGGNGAGRDMRFVVIGAGMAGILTGIRLRQAGYENFAIYEKADRVGGTWRENSYPGLSCDVPAHAYTYSFEPNPEFTHKYAPGDQIQSYFERVARKYGVMERIRFNEEIDSCVHEPGGWVLRTKSGTTDRANFVIAATGVLHHPSYPDIEGLDSFAGACFHSARWDHSVPLDGRRVGVVGAGSTGVQIVSALAGRASVLKHFQRTPQWVRVRENPAYTAEEIAGFRADPTSALALLQDPAYIEGSRIFAKAVSDADSPEMKAVEAAITQGLEQAVKDPVLREKLRPNYRAACKRLIISPDYYEKVQYPGVEVITDKIARVEPKGVRTMDGVLHELDVLALATGFKADMFLRPMNVVGRGGVKLSQVWEERPSAYLSIAMPDFPNLFMLNGPTSPVGNFSLIDIAERELEYVFQLVDLVRDGKCREVAPTQAAQRDYDEARTIQASRTIFASGCKSWYLDAQGRPNIWPYTYDHFVEEMTAPKLEHYELAA